MSLAFGVASAFAVPYSTVSSTWGFSAGTAILGARSVGATGGIGATNATSNDGAAVYIGNTSTATSGTTNAGIVYAGTGGRSVNINSGAVNPGVVLLEKSGNTSAQTGTHIRDAATGAGNTASIGQLRAGGGSAAGRTGSNVAFSVTSPVQTGGTGALTATSNTVTSSIADGSSSVKTGVQGVVATLSGGTNGIPGTGNSDFSCNGTAANCGTNPVVNAGRNGYYSVYVSNTLQTNLQLQGRSASDYVFVYLANGMSAGGAISLASTTTQALDASHIIIVSNGDVALSGTSNVGTYIMGSGKSITFANNATLSGGVFISNNSTTTASELIFAGNATITANPWNGYIAAGAPEPEGATVLGVGLLGLGVSRRRRSRICRRSTWRISPRNV